MQDAAGKPETGHKGHRRLVSPPSASAGRGTARRARSTSARSLQLLRRQWQLSESPATRRSDEAGVVHVAVPSQPAQASQLGEVYGSPPTDASSPPTDHGPDLGCVTTSHIDGRAGWWKSPCPALARGRGGQPPGLLYNGLFQRPGGWQCDRQAADRWTADASVMPGTRCRAARAAGLGEPRRETVSYATPTASGENARRRGCGPGVGLR